MGAIPFIRHRAGVRWSSGRGGRAGLLAILAGGAAERALEGEVEVLGMLEAYQLGDAMHRMVGLGEQPPGVAELDVADLGLGRTSQVFAESPFEGGPREGDAVEHVADGD